MINVGFEVSTQYPQSHVFIPISSNQCGLDPVAVAHAQVYFEKLVLMVIINNS